MDRKRNSHYGSFDGITFMEIPEPTYDLNVVEDNSELNRLLGIIFAPDEFGSIQGDLGFVLNENVDPQIVNFVKSQLLFDTTQSVQSPLPSWMSDDDAVELRRNDNETMDSYAERLAKKMIELKDSMKQSNQKKDE